MANETDDDYKNGIEIIELMSGKRLFVNEFIQPGDLKSKCRDYLAIAFPQLSIQALSKDLEPWTREKL